MRLSKSDNRKEEEEKKPYCAPFNEKTHVDVLLLSVSLSLSPSLHSVVSPIIVSFFFFPNSSVFEVSKISFRQMSSEGPQRTALLCKPSSQDAHHIIVQELQTSGLVIEQRLLNLTPEQAVGLVMQYPSVKARLASHTTPSRSSHALLTCSTAPAPASAELEEASDKETEWPEFIKAARRHRWSHTALSPPDHRLLANIQLLAPGNHNHPATASTPAAGVPASQQSVKSANARPRSRGTDMLNSQPLSGNSSRSTPARGSPIGTFAYRRPQLCFPTPNVASPRLALDTVLDHPALEDPLVRRHVEHLIQDGTDLVLLVCGVDAVERLRQLAGPESVEEARRMAPGSWTARFGRDDVRNAVYAPRTLADAQAVTRALFQLSFNEWTRRATRQKQPALQQPSQDHLAEVNPPTSSSPPPQQQQPLTFAAILPALRSEIGASQRLSYYTGASNSPAGPAPAMPVLHDAAQTSVCSSSGIGQGETSAEANAAQATQATTTSTLAHSATARLPSAASYPERRERLDEFDNLLRQHAVGC